MNPGRRGRISILNTILVIIRWASTYLRSQGRLNALLQDGSSVQTYGRISVAALAVGDGDTNSGRGI